MKFAEFESKVYGFVAETLEQERTKNSPEMVSALSELVTSLKTISSEQDD